MSISDQAIHDSICNFRLPHYVMPLGDRQLRIDHNIVGFPDRSSRCCSPKSSRVIAEQERQERQRRALLRSVLTPALQASNNVPLQGSKGRQARQQRRSEHEAGGQSMAQRGVNEHGCCILPVTSGRELIASFAKQTEHGISHIRVE